MFAYISCKRVQEETGEKIEIAYLIKATQAKTQRMRLKNMAFEGRAASISKDENRAIVRVGL